MVERTELEKRVRRLIASDRTYRILNTLGQKGVKRLNKRAYEITELLAEGAEEGERFSASVGYEPELKRARTLKTAIDEIKERYPDMAKEIDELIEEKREENSFYLTYYLKQDFKLSEEDYAQVMMDLGFEKREAYSLYPHILSIADRLKKPDEYEVRKIIVPKS